MHEPISRFIDTPTVADRLGCSTRTVENMVRRGEMPPPVKVSPRLVRWPEEVFQRWAVERCRAVAA